MIWPICWSSSKAPNPIRTGTTAAENLIAAFVAYVCATEGNPACRNLRGMRTYIASRPLYTQALAVMQAKEEFYGVLQQMGHSLGWHVDKELGSVMSNVQRHTNIFDSPLVADSTERTSLRSPACCARAA